MEVSVEQEIKQIKMGKSHVVILGAGASYAAFQNGDKNGVKLPLMNNFVDILGLNDLLTQTGNRSRGRMRAAGSICYKCIRKHLNIY